MSIGLAVDLRQIGRKSPLRFQLILIRHFGTCSVLCGVFLTSFAYNSGTDMLHAQMTDIDGRFSHFFHTALDSAKCSGECIYDGNKNNVCQDRSR